MNVLDSTKSRVTCNVSSHGEHKTLCLPRYHCSLCVTFVWRISEMKLDKEDWKLLVESLFCHRFIH